MYIGARSGASLQQRGCAEERRGRRAREGREGERFRVSLGAPSVCRCLLPVGAGWSAFGDTEPCVVSFIFFFRVLQMLVFVWALADIECSGGAF